MKIHKGSELTMKGGDIMMLYGEPGVGKSVTSLQTATEPILYIMTEPKDVTKFMLATGKENLDADFVFYEGWTDMMEFVCNIDNFKRYNSIIVDSISHLMSVNLSDEILEEGFDALESKSKKEVEKPLTMRAKMSQEGYGSLATNMIRFTQAITLLSQAEKVVICIARLEQSPKYNRSYSAAPLLKGQEYAKHMQGFFDFIGIVESRTDKEGKVIYPPAVSFEGDGSFMCRWSGKTPKGGVQNRPLNVEKILQAARGQNGSNIGPVYPGDPLIKNLEA